MASLELPFNCNQKAWTTYEKGGFGELGEWTKPVVC